MSWKFWGAIVVLAALRPQAFASEVAVAWDNPAGGGGLVRAVSTSDPWPFVSDPLPVGRQAVLRFAQGNLFALSRVDDTLTVIDPRTWTVARTYQLSSGSAAVDIAVTDSQTAYVARQNATHLMRLDLADGSIRDVLDLSLYADSDGVPDLGTMSVFEGRLFVQIQRQNEHGPFGFAPPAYLAVMDVATEQLIDADPVLPGVQAVELLGTAPKLKMQVVPETRQLFVSATGAFFDEGGIEVVDLDGLRSQGLVIREADGNTGADLRPFVMVSPRNGFLASSTDLLPSSHLHQFSLDGVDPTELHVAVDYLAPALEFDPRTNSVFFPHGDGLGSNGLHVFDAVTGRRLNADLVPLGGQPTDLTLVPEPAAGVLLLVAASLLVGGRRRRVACFADSDRPTNHTASVGKALVQFRAR